MKDFKMILLIDSRRNFLDGREALVARDNKKALELLQKYENKIKAIWLDDDINGAKGLTPVLEYLTLRGKMGMRYPVSVINVHTQNEGGWQLLNARLKAAGYIVNRVSVRDTLGSY